MTVWLWNLRHPVWAYRVWRYERQEYSRMLQARVREIVERRRAAVVSLMGPGEDE